MIRFCKERDTMKAVIKRKKIHLVFQQEKGWMSYKNTIDEEEKNLIEQMRMSEEQKGGMEDKSGAQRP
ncbi:hypothetical protein OWV82_008802 [Melia azedarach]|uniref:Uncharacterized protein n=1 Tax=Melia azedarach TaxID=155640 RepID=A0ACC1YBH7_MELAZ|nr:hypothetical protein OWV82_008802 [Melia azedarach]